jgi:hypothetical protein
MKNKAMPKVYLGIAILTVFNNVTSFLLKPQRPLLLPDR